MGYYRNVCLWYCVTVCYGPMIYPTVSMAMFNGHVTNLPTEYAARYGGWHQQAVYLWPLHPSMSTCTLMNTYTYIRSYVCVYICRDFWISVCSFVLKRLRTEQRLAGWIWPVWSTTWAWCLGSEWPQWPHRVDMRWRWEGSRMEGMYSSSKELIMIYNQWLISYDLPFVISLPMRIWLMLPWDGGYMSYCLASVRLKLPW